MKKRSCRRTPDEDRIHNEAVKLRKLTDEQLVNYVEGKTERKKGPDLGKTVTEIMTGISEVKGVGKTKLHYIQEIIEEKLEEAYG